MGKGSSKAPAAPDPQKTAAAEAQYNRLDTYGPSGSGTMYGYTDASGNFVRGIAPPGMQSAVKSVESPIETAMRKALEPASLNLTNRIIADNVTNLPEAARIKDRGTVAQSIFDRTFSMMKPAIDQGNSRLLTNLQARGIPIGGEAFNEAYGEQQAKTQDTISRLAMDADIQAGQEQSRLFGLDQSQRSNAMAEIVAAMGGGYNPPSNVPSGAAANVNYSGLVGEKYKADMAQYQSDQQNKAATAGAIGSLGGALLMKSDRRLKADIRAIGRRGPFTLYEFRYLWDTPGTVRRGYMAQDVIKIIPAAVHRVRWWMEVDYSMLPEVN
ncbi:MAG: tail fiber domain-containing protein [Hyphomicrobiaceae bacterium]|nr:MAG: tail fiber domain-containing protein [Hyphomicrobiaceae bacterium]